MLMQSNTPNRSMAAAIIKHLIALLLVVFSNIARYDNTNDPLGSEVFVSFLRLGVGDFWYIFDPKISDP